MKQKILATALAAAFAALSASAQTDRGLTLNAGDFKNISIAENMDVVLLTGGATAATFFISRDAGERLDIKLSGQTLTVERRNDTTKGTVYLTVHCLEKLTLGENTVVHVNGLVTTPELQLFIDANAKAYVRTTGKIKAHTITNGELAVEPLTPNGKTDRVTFY